MNASDIRVICRPERSTTEYSTGVMMFPNAEEYTASYIDEKIPADQSNGLNKTLMLSWFQNAGEAYEYWKDDLNLIDWSLGDFEPKDYQGGSGKKQVISCDSGDCGTDLVNKLSRDLNITRGIVTEVTRNFDGRFR